MIQSCNQALAIDHQYSKGYYRRAKAHIAMGNHLEGARDFSRIMKLEPNNEPVQKELDETVEKHLTDKDKELLAKESAVGSGCQGPSTEQAGQYRRLAIVEDDDDEEEDDEKEKIKKVAHEQKVKEPAVKQQIAGSRDSNMTIPSKDTVKIDQKSPSKQVDTKDRSVFIKQLRKRQQLKEAAVVEIRKAMFENAINMMSKELDYFDEDDIRLAGLTDELSLEYYALKMSFHANLALCYAQNDLPNKVIEFCDTVVDSFNAHLKIKERIGELESIDYAILEKTLLRKALALEKADKFRKARTVYNEVRQRFPHNLQASQGIYRCDDYLGDKEIDYSPTSASISPPLKSSSSLLEKTTPVEVKKPAEQKILKVEEIKSPEPTNNSADLLLSLEHFEKIKEEGNAAFKKSDFVKAFDIFSKIVNGITLKYPNIDNEKDGNLCKLLVSVLSNRAFTCHKIKKFYQGIEDCNRIIKIDPDNAKAYYRRYLCEEEIAAELRNERKKFKEYSLIVDMLKKEKSFIENCISDLDIVMKHAKEAQYKQKRDELNGILEALNEELKKLNPTEKPAGVEVLNSTETPESKKEPTPTPAQKKPISETLIQPKEATNINIDEITVQALDKIINNSAVPNNASKFEVELKSFKTYYAKMWQYFQKFDGKDFLANLYKSREIEAFVSKQVIGCLSEVFKNE